MRLAIHVGAILRGTPRLLLCPSLLLLLLLLLVAEDCERPATCIMSASFCMEHKTQCTGFPPLFATVTDADDAAGPPCERTQW